MSCPSWQWHRTGSRWFPVRTLPVAPLWCDLGFVPNSRGNKAAANLRPRENLTKSGIDTAGWWSLKYYGHILLKKKHINILNKI